MPQLGQHETFPHRKTFSLSHCLHQIGPLRNRRLQFKPIERHLNGDVDLYASVKHSVVLLNLPQWVSCDKCILPSLVVYVAPRAPTRFVPSLALGFKLSEAFVVNISALRSAVGFNEGISRNSSWDFAACRAQPSSTVGFHRFRGWKRTISALPYVAGVGFIGRRRPC